MKKTAIKLKVPAFLFCCLFAQQLLAQQENAQPLPIGISMQLGIIASGPGRSVYKHMENSGFGQTTSVIWERDYPNKIQLAGKADITHALNNRFGIKGTYFHYFGKVVGHNTNRRWPVRVNLYSPVVMGYRRSRDQVFYLGAGPSLNFVKFTSGSAFTTPPITSNFVKLGLVLESGFRFPAHSRFFADIQGRYAWVGKEKVGPYTVEVTSWLEDLLFLRPSFSGGSRTVSAFDVSFTTFTFNLGGGIRLGTSTKKNNSKL